MHDRVESAGALSSFAQDVSTPETARVAAQYERFPYPERNPHDERRRVIGTWIDNLDIVNFRCYRGETPFIDGFRVLVAGGGTGDATIYLALQLRDTNAEIVHLDVSEASIDIARRRAAIHGLTRIRFIHASLLDLASLELGTFDYINCVGVLHHLADPDAGLGALLAVLDPHGAMGLMLYGQYGRIGVYQLQEVLHRLAGAESDARKLAFASTLLAHLPATNWFRRGEDLHSDHKTGDAGIYDLLLHSQDRAYTVAELYAWLADGHGLHIHFSDVHRGELPYDPVALLRDADIELLERLAHLPLRERQSIAELLRGDLTRHVLYATRDREPQAPYGELDFVPRIPPETHQPTGADLASLIDRNKHGRFVLQHPASGLQQVMDYDAHAAAIFRELDGVRSFREIFGLVREQSAFRANPPADAVLFASFRPWFDALASIERMVLLRKDRPWPIFSGSATGRSTPR